MMEYIQGQRHGSWSWCKEELNHLILDHFCVIFKLLYKVAKEITSIKKFVWISTSFSSYFLNVISDEFLKGFRVMSSFPFECIQINGVESISKST